MYDVLKLRPHFRNFEMAKLINTLEKSQPASRKYKEYYIDWYHW